MKRYLLGILIILITVAEIYSWQQMHPTMLQTNTQSPPVVQGFNKQRYSLTNPNSIWVVVNKQRPLNPRDYAPLDLVFPKVPQRVPGDESMQLRSSAATALEAMFAAAKQSGLDLMLSSGYRSYSYQNYIYNSYVRSQGQAATDQQSARPGYSEHQTGMAVDIAPVSRVCDTDPCFADTPEGKWLATNAYRFGFILRYSSGSESLTGYEYEAWHFRYVGTILAAEMHKEHIATMEQFFGVSGGATYAE